MNLFYFLIKNWISKEIWNKAQTFVSCMHASEVHKLRTSYTHAIAYMQCSYTKVVKMHTCNWTKYCQNVHMYMIACICMHKIVCACIIIFIRVITKDFFHHLFWNSWRVYLHNCYSLHRKRYRLLTLNSANYYFFNSKECFLIGFYAKNGLV